jgi:hypothetical protein
VGLFYHGKGFAAARLSIGEYAHRVTYMRVIVCRSMCKSSVTICVSIERKGGRKVRVPLIQESTSGDTSSNTSSTCVRVHERVCKCRSEQDYTGVDEALAHGRLEM